MIFTNTISIILALAPATLFAAPTRTINSLANLVPRQDLPSAVVQDLKDMDGPCDLSNVHLPVAPTPLAAIGAGYTLRHIAIGRGSQNYTCASSSSTDVPVSVGAIASLFNATCDAARLNVQVLTDVTRLALNYAVPTIPEAEARLSGHHEFTEQKVPLFILETDAVNYGYVQGTVDAVKSAPPKDASPGLNGLGSVPWIKVNGVEGDYKEVYRVNTAGGVAPKTCEGIEGSFEVQYSAQYWFYA